MQIRKQRGLSLVGFILLLVLALFFAYIGMKIVPIYLNYYSVASAMDGVAEEPGVESMSPARVRDLLFRRLYVNYVEDVKPEHVRIVRGNGLTLNVAYEVREPLIANMDVVVKFDRSVQLN